MAIEPYLFFNGRCEEAVEFYKKALGAEVLMLMRFKDSPEPPAPVRSASRRRSSADAAGKDVLVALLRYGRRPFRRRLDGDGSNVTSDRNAWS